MIHKPLIILTKINRYYGVTKILTFNNKTFNIYPDLIRELKIVVISIALQSNRGTLIRRYHKIFIRPFGILLEKLKV